MNGFTYFVYQLGCTNSGDVVGAKEGSKIARFQTVTFRHTYTLLKFGIFKKKCKIEAIFANSICASMLTLMCY